MMCNYNKNKVNLPSHGTKRRRTEEPTMRKQTPYIKPQLYKEELQQSALERSVENYLGFNPSTAKKTCI